MVQRSKEVFEFLSDKDCITLLGPGRYPSFTWLMMESNISISAFGGFQEEAIYLFRKGLSKKEFFQKRMKGVEAGCSFLVGTQKIKSVEKAVGDGKDAKRIVKFLLNEAKIIS